MSFFSFLKMRGVNFYKDHPCVNDFGVSVGTNFVNLEARILSPPQIEYNDKVIIYYKHRPNFRAIKNFFCQVKVPFHAI